MAIRQKPSGAWEVYYRHPITGKRKSETCLTQKDAVQRDALIKYRLKFERETFEVEEQQEPKEAMTFDDVLWLYLRSKNYDRSSLAGQLKEFKEWLSEFSGVYIQDITKEKMAKLRDKMLARGCVGNTVRRRFTAMKALLRWCLREEHIEKMPSFPEIQKSVTKQFVPPTKAEVLTMLKFAPPHLQRVIIIGFCFGARVGPCEMFRLSWDDVDFDRKVIRMPSSKKNKREPWRELPIRNDLLPVFAMWKEQDSAYETFPETVIHYMGKSVKRIDTVWGNTLKKAHLRFFRPYDLRHAFATEAIAAGVDVGTTAKMMGHTSPVMLLSTYQHVMDRQKKEAMEAIPCVSESVCLKRMSL